MTKKLEINRCYDADETTIAGNVFASILAYTDYPQTLALPEGMMCEIKAFWSPDCKGGAASTDNYSGKCIDVDKDPENTVGSVAKRVAKSLMWECCYQDMVAKADGVTKCVYPVKPSST